MENLKFNAAKFITAKRELAIVDERSNTFSLISKEGHSLNFKAGYYDSQKHEYVEELRFWRSEKYDHQTKLRDATQAEWVHAAENWGVPVVRLASISGNGSHYREVSALAWKLGIEEHRYSTGTGTDDIGAGIRWTCYTKCFLFPVSVSETATLHLYDKLELGEEKMLEGWSGHDKVLFVDDDYNGFLAWVEIKTMDSVGKEYKSIKGHIFSHEEAYIDTQGKKWSYKELQNCPFLPPAPTAILWGSTGWGMLLCDEVTNSQKYKESRWSSECYGGHEFPKIQFK